LFQIVYLPGLPAMNMLGSSSSAPGGTLSKNQLQAGSSSSGSPGMRHDGNFGENSLFDINDFPQLVGRPNSAGNIQGLYGNADMQTKYSE
jgi:CCR4-NOT transcription complex subunit 2